MVAANGVVVGDGAAVGNHRIAGGRLEFAPHFDFGAATAHAAEAVVGRRAIGVDVGEAAAERAAAAHALECRRHDFADVGIEFGPAVPGDRGFEGISHDAHAGGEVALVGRA